MAAELDPKALVTTDEMLEYLQLKETGTPPDMVVKVCNRASTFASGWCLRTLPSSAYAGVNPVNDCQGDEVLVMPDSPIGAVTKVAILDRSLADSTVLVAGDDYIVSDAKAGLITRLPLSRRWPRPELVAVDLVAGYGYDIAAASPDFYDVAQVPADLKEAVLGIGAHMYTKWKARDFLYVSRVVEGVSETPRDVDMPSESRLRLARYKRAEIQPVY